MAALTLRVETFITKLAGPGWLDPRELGIEALGEVVIPRIRVSNLPDPHRPQDRSLPIPTKGGHNAPKKRKNRILMRFSQVVNSVKTA